MNRSMSAVAHNLRRRPRPLRSGFTLIESAIVLVIVGVGTVAMIQLLAAGSMANSTSHQLTTGLNLAKSIREMTQSMTYQQILNLNGQTFSPPVDAMSQEQADLAAWSQAVTIHKVDPNYLTLTVAPTVETPMARARVEISHQGEFVCDFEWLVVDTDE